MNSSDKPGEPEIIPCEVCLKEIPKSEATSAELDDYVAYLCGLNCYAKWKDKNKTES